ncbi:MAG: ATP-binding protein [Bacteroidetes bacterium 4484_276]|nr:MAG: ATP-binding protein [Bacteroidetes bacterium 4484_276]
MIETINLTKAYNGQVVLDLPNLKINKGESFGLVGNNGAGKTTFFMLILDLIRSTTGEVKINNENVAGNDEWKKITGSFLDENFLIDFLSPEEYFEFLANIQQLPKGDLEKFYEDFETFFNGEILNKKKYIRELSRGNQQKVGIAAALLTRPDILVLDEPFNGLDPTTQIRLINLLNKLKEQTGITMLISSHDLSHVTDVCERILVLHEGKIYKDIQKSSTTLKELEEYFAA